MWPPDGLPDERVDACHVPHMLSSDKRQVNDERQLLGKVLINEIIGRNPSGVEPIRDHISWLGLGEISPLPQLRNTLSRHYSEIAHMIVQGP